MSSSNRIQLFANDLMMTAQRLRGRYTLMDIKSLDVEPSTEPIKVVVDFDEDEYGEAVQVAMKAAGLQGVLIDVVARSLVDDQTLMISRLQGNAHSIGERPPFAKLMSKHSRLAVPRIDGWGRIGFGWVSIIDRFFDVIDRIVPEDVEFEVTQIKEKFGGLRLNCRPAREEEPTSFFARDAETSSLRSEGGTSSPVTDWENELRMARILAEQRSFYTCEKCGRPGRLRHTSVLFTACDEHAINADGKVAEIYEQNRVVRVDDKRYRYNPEEDKMEELKRELEQVAGLDEYAVKSIRQNLREQWELDDFTVLHAVKRLDWGGDGNAGYTVIVRMDDTDEVELFETETWACPFRSNEETLQETVQLYRNLADQTEILLSKFRELKEVDNAPKP